jgi:hypothetical protein
MKGTCKLCGAVIETDPDPVMDEQRQQRERTQFFNRIAFHIDPKNKRCTANNSKLPVNRFAIAMQDNGWFQRWRLLACLDNLDSYSLSKQEEWREYLHAITSKEAGSAPESPQPPEARPDKPSVN